MDQPLISVIVPVYNVAPYLERCLDSIAAQTWGNLEVWLVDDGSTDDSAALCAAMFTLFHFPCGTTCLTIWRETRSLKWTALAVALPTAVGMGLCAAVNLLCQIL